MIYTKIFTKTITLTDVNDIYNTDIDNLLLKKLQNIFENKCFQSCYIKSINKIIYRSDINFNNKDLNGSVNISIKFEASIIQYDKFDIINNIKITAITENKIICQSQNASIFIHYSDKLKNYKDGQIISIKVGICKYYLGINEISINAFPFVPLSEEFENEIYYNINYLTDDEINELNDLDIIKNIEDAEKERDSIKKEKGNRWGYFDDLLYPFKTNKKINKNMKEIGILEFDKLQKDKSNIISLLPYQKLSSKKMILIDPISSKSNIKKFGNDNYPIEENSVVIFQILLTKYFKHIKTINELSTIYKTADMFKKHENIFDTYRVNKL